MKRTVSLAALISLALVLAFGLVLIMWTTSSTPTVAAQATGAPQATPSPTPTPSPGAPTNPTINSIEEALGTLGIFAAFMLLLAVGTEAVIDGVKVALGFKSKPTALQAVNDLKEWLPGQLQEMSGDAAAVRQLNKTLDALSSHISNVDQAATAISTVDQWLPDALKNLSVGNVEQLLTRNLPRLKDELKKAGIADADIATAETWLRGALSTLQATTAKELMAQAQMFMVALQTPAKTASEVRKFLDEWLHAQLPKLTTLSAVQVLTNELPDLEADLRSVGVPDATIQQVKVWISGALTYLDTASSNAFTVALTNVLQGVEDRREAIQSPLRKLWRWIAKKLNLKQQTRASDRVILPLNPANIARVLLQRDDLQRDEEISRLRWLRVVSIFIGLGLAILLQVDVGLLLQPIITNDLFKVLTTHFTPAPWLPFGLGNLIGQMSVGILISGLASSAGSTFWHDTLDRLQASKKTVQDVGDLVTQLRQLESSKE